MNKHLLGKILMILILVFVLVLGLAIVLEIQSNKAQTIVDLPSEELPTPTTAPAKPLSKWATDSALIEAENDLKIISKKIKETDLTESGLLPPVLDMAVKFQ